MRADAGNETGPAGGVVLRRHGGVGIGVVGRDRQGCLSYGERGERCLHVSVGNLRQMPARGAGRAERGEALPRVAGVLPEVLGDQGFEQGVLPRRSAFCSSEQVTQRFALVLHPGVERGQKLGSVDEVVLQSEHSEEKVTLGGHGTFPGLG